MNVNGVFRGVVEDINDPEARRRYRVRVANVHRPETPPSHLPWAETANFQGKFHGLFQQYAVGDLVFVMFEGGGDGPDEKKPIIIGGWLGESGGTPDLPPVLAEDYPRSARRTLWVDRSGNTIEMSDLEEELHVRLQSGLAYVKVSKRDDTVEIVAPSRVKVTAPSVRVYGASEIIATTEQLTATVVKKAVLTCQDQTYLRSLGAIHIGQYDRGDVVETTKSIIEQADSEYLLEVGPKNAPVAGTVPNFPGGNLSLRATGQGRLDIDAASDISAITETDVNIAAKVNIVVAADADVTLKSGGAMRLDAGGAMTLKSAVSIGLEAPLIQETADQAITRDAGVSIMDTAGTSYDVSSGGTYSVTAAASTNITALAIDLTSTTSMTLNAAVSLVYTAPVIAGTAVLGMTLIGGAFASFNGAIISIGL